MAIEPRFAPSADVLNQYNEIIKQSIGWDYYAIQPNMSFLDWCNYVNSNFLGGNLVDQYRYLKGSTTAVDRLGVGLKAGDYFNAPSVAGAAEEYVATTLLPTDATYNAAEQTMTATFGNVVEEATGDVKKKGLRLGATKGAKVAMGALGAFGAIAQGVEWYRDNPEFWTDLSMKLLPFAYDDPTNKSWSDIFYEALVPTAVDSDGTTYVQADMIEALAAEMTAQKFFEEGETTSYMTTEMVDALQSTNSRESYMLQAMRKLASSGYKLNISKSGMFNFPDARKAYGSYTTNGVTLNVQNQDTEEGYEPRIWTLCAIEGDMITDIDIQGTWTHIVNGKEQTDSVIDYYDGFFQQPTVIKAFGKSIVYRREENAIDPYPTMLPNIYIYPEKVREPVYNFEGLMYVALFGIQETTRTVPNTSIVPGATHPQIGVPLSQTYPEWYNNAVTTVNPYWKPDEEESEENKKYVTWLPLQFPSTTVPDGSTQPDSTPQDAQSGLVLPDSPVNPDTDTALNTGVLPNPYPQPETEPSTGTTTDTPTIPTDVEPTPGVPVIAGGTANALWKIYNPSVDVLRQFGAWLWSSDPVKMIKELFSNNPADGIIGLHMIYVTPPIGGTANIVVGYVDSGVASQYVSQQYVHLDCGSVTIPMRYQSALDFGYTKIYCYLPFIGIVPLDSFDIVGKTVHITYVVDVLTGTVLAQVAVNSGGYDAVLYTFNGSCSVEYPLTSGSRASQMLSLITGAVGGAVVGGAGGAILGGARGALTGADVRMSGNLAGNAGAMGIRRPYIIVKRPVESAALNYNSFYGYPANITDYVNNFSGYVRAKSVHVENIRGALREEKDEIEKLLKSGIIVN